MHRSHQAGLLIAGFALALVLSAIPSYGLAGLQHEISVISSSDAPMVLPSVHSMPSLTPTFLSPGRGPSPGFQWTNISTPHMPVPRLSGEMVFDSHDGYVLLFGGESSLGGPLIWQNDTWTFSGGTWTNATNPARTPSGRFGAGLADDPADHEVVLFGGSSYRSSYLNDTWTYSSGVWTNVSPTHSPPPMFWAAMAYDNQTDSVLLFGGNTGGAPSQAYTNQTWEFHANLWTNITTAVAPPPRDGGTMIYDAADGSMVLFGGLGPSNYYNDTWTYSGGAWSPVSAPGAPDARSGTGMAYDPDLSKVVVFGGSPTTDALSTFTYAGGTWTAYSLVPTPPETTTWGQMTYDYADHYLVLFDGSGYQESNSTWKLNLTSGTPPPALQVAGSAVPQSGPAPLHVAFGSNVSGGTPPYTVSWNFGDATGGSALGNVSHTYTTAGMYNATVTVRDSGSDRVVKYWIITATPPALTLSISASPTSVRVNQTVTFSATPGGGVPPYTYAWTFADGGSSTSQNPTHSYSAIGNYVTQLILHDSTGSSISKTIVITVSAGPSSSSSNSSWWVYAVAVVAVIIVALLIVLLFRRRRRCLPRDSETPPAPPAASLTADAGFASAFSHRLGRCFPRSDVRSGHPPPSGAFEGPSRRSTVGRPPTPRRFTL